TGRNSDLSRSILVQSLWDSLNNKPQNMRTENEWRNETILQASFNRYSSIMMDKIFLQIEREEKEETKRVSFA
ncbi:377_t:CDS:2, partial [Funneliformis geosporum]